MVAVLFITMVMCRNDEFTVGGGESCLNLASEMLQMIARVTAWRRQERIEELRLKKATVLLTCGASDEHPDPAEPEDRTSEAENTAALKGGNVFLGLQ